LLTFSLQSGSNGNSIYVETSEVRLLFDAGISGRATEERLAAHGRDIRAVDALILSHNHRDHVCGAGVLQRRFSLPIFITPRSYRACREDLGTCGDIRYFDPGQTLDFGRIAVQTVPTAHDGKDGVAFIISEKGRKLGIFTDLGHRFAGIETWISTLDGMYLESNYDPDMLAEGMYPSWLKRRIRGQGGHLSNLEAAELVRDTTAQLQFLILSHLSENNNEPELALATARKFLGESFPLALAPRDRVGEIFSL